MDRDRYEPSQYSERGFAARDGYVRDARSDAYERSQYGPYDRDDYVATRSNYGGASTGYDRRRSYDDHDMDEYYEKTRVTRYSRDGGEPGLAAYEDRDRQRARSQDYRRQEDRREERPRSRGRRDSESGSENEREGENTPMKKWAATLAGAAVGGLAAKRLQKDKDNNWVPTALGAVVGGLLGREVEKKVYEHKERRKEREHEYE
ncbi:hypothetical protein, variant 2 [Verruconis gallopava]|uniref:Glycine zipper 2TM domain-containing protein n=1 Tax=Verruconis gallopava TaxID=253628 RepID=A0A0D1XP60_9PEZI|nr:uncharacterized protein PV09_04646 [Verruconis gallopava]XP_016214230.1 hypothetical protein, variant 1 [Verruconis gallopava]XP_016214231.1 hypothetical protein, variant 2 [Verruconis gallopava]KIW04360.1 hypothetical protein PV09_04646 [Verruconis gallopava]KIW04361.1 hypothetical protein, variant 1 [Verruconis gallopava]KIW04362.1 hypothetical protein, variant 2 [Verruconis gallopava]